MEKAETDASHSDSIEPAEERTVPYDLVHDHPIPTEYPRIAPDLEPVGGRIRVHAEDFEVEEIPLYDACGRGEHCFVTVVKTNRTTLEAREFLAREVGVAARDIGFAGFKDKRAVAKQTFSIQGIKVQDVLGIDEPWLKVLSATFHRNKLRTGHLKGNRFRITVRDIEPGSVGRAQQIVARLAETGLPNFYGPQRFGHFGDSYHLGLALLRREPKLVAEQLLAPRPDRDDEFRHLYAKQRYEEALKALPRGRAAEAAMLHALRKYPGNLRAAVRKIPREMTRMYFSAYQSFLFNWCLHERLAWGPTGVTTPVEGDLAFIHEKGACFVVEDVGDAEERAARGEISPSGPIFGRKMKFPTHRPGLLEHRVHEVEGLRPQSWLSHVRGLQLNGTRRPLRIPLADAICEAGEDENTLVLTFTLPPGGYATILLEEVMGEGRTRATFDLEELTEPD